MRSNWISAVALMATVFGLWAGITPAHAEAVDAAKHQAAGQGESGGHGGADAHAAPNPLGFDPDLAIATAIIFLVLLGFLWFFAWAPISEALERREHTIAENIASAERVAADAKVMLADYDRKLAGAADEVRGMLEEARRDAEATKQEIVAEARVAAKAEQDRAMREIGVAKDAALKELAERSADLAVELAGKLIRTKLTKDDHAGLVNDALGKFVGTAASRN
jgi:F-type H+-transporting ATPase subunit b